MQRHERMHLHDEQAEGVQEASHLAEDEMQEINHSAATGVTRVSDQEDDEMQLNNEAEDEALRQVINPSAPQSVIRDSTTVHEIQFFSIQESAFSCSHCDYKCSTSSSLKTHERVHKSVEADGHN